MARMNTHLISQIPREYNPDCKIKVLIADIDANGVDDIDVNELFHYLFATNRLNLITGPSSWIHQ